MNKKTFSITKLEEILNKLGGRTLDDLEVDEGGRDFVFMWSAENNSYVKYYLDTIDFIR